MRGLALASSGDPRDKLKLSFDVFDVEGTGTIAQWEMMQVLEGIFVTAEQFENDATPAESRHDISTSSQQEQRTAQIESFVTDVFASYDKDKSGQLSFMEYIGAAMRYPNLTNFMNNAAIFDAEESDATKETETPESSAAKAGGEMNAEERLDALEDLNIQQQNRLNGVERKLGSSTEAEATNTTATSHVRPYLSRFATANSSNISRDDILKLKHTFDRLSSISTESPNEIEKKQFKKVLDEFNIQWKNDAYLNRLFDVVDYHGSNTINYQECLVGLSMLIKGNPQERMSLSFELFDVNGSGTISKLEMTTVLRAVGEKETSETDLLQFVDTIFDKSDKDHSGTLSLREFVNAALKFEQLIVVAK